MILDIFYGENMNVVIASVECIGLTLQHLCGKQLSEIPAIASRHGWHRLSTQDCSRQGSPYHIHSRYRLPTMSISLTLCDLGEEVFFVDPSDAEGGPEVGDLYQVALQVAQAHGWKVVSESSPDEDDAAAAMDGIARTIHLVRTGSTQ